MGTIAMIKLSDRIAGSLGIGLVLTARFLPGFFLAPLAGVLVDRLDRKKVMVACDLGRAAVLSAMPFVNRIWGLVLVAFLLELLTLMWSPAKDASVPNLVRPGSIATAGSLGLAAAYGTFPLAAGASSGLFKVAEWLSGYSWLHFLRVNNESVLIYFDVLTFVVSAVLISSLHLPHRVRETHPVAGAAAAVSGVAGGAQPDRIDFGKALGEAREGLTFIRTSPVVRAVMVGLGTALMGGGLAIPLGKVFTDRVLGAGDSGYSLVLLAMGVGAAIGVISVIVLQRRLPRDFMFCSCVLGGGVALLTAASMSALGAAIWCVGAFGLCAGAAFVLGQTILQSDTEDALRGRIFAAFYALIRLALVIPLVFGPFVSAGLDRLSRRVFGDDERVVVAGIHVDLPGVRLTLWLGAIVIVLASFLSFSTLGRRRHRTGRPS